MKTLSDILYDGPELGNQIFALHALCAFGVLFLAGGLTPIITNWITHRRDKTPFIFITTANLCAWPLLLVGAYLLMNAHILNRSTTLIEKFMEYALHEDFVIVADTDHYNMQIPKTHESYKLSVQQIQELREFMPKSPDKILAGNAPKLNNL